MSKNKDNRCARCGVPIHADEDLCKVCSRDATSRVSMIPCRACGHANSSSAPLCGECGAPLQSRPTREEPSSGRTERRAELQVLEDVFNVCMDKGHVGGTIVSGESGMGATTLLKAFAERLTGRLSKRNIIYVITREQGEAFSPLRGVLLQWFEISRDEDPTTCRLQLTQKVGKVLGVGSAAQVTETTHLLGYLAGVPFPESPVLKSLEADQTLLKKRLKETLVLFLKAAIRKEPRVLILDDMHKAQAETQSMTMEILDELGSVPLTVVAGGRPEVNRMTDNSSVVRVVLEPIDNEVMRRLFSSFMPKLVDPPRDLVEATINRAAGNPGSLRELCALLAESGVVDTSREPWTADVTKLAMADMPVNLLDALKARVEQLDPRDRKVLEHAAIFGEVFWDEAVVSLSRQDQRLKENISAAQIWADDSDGLTISSALDRLVERQFVVQLPDRDIKGCIKYAFARSGIRGEIIKGLDKERRKTGHFLCAAWLAHVAQDMGVTFYEAEAAHWIAAGERHNATLAYFGAARRARSRYLNQKTIKLFREGIEIADERHRVVLADALHDLGSVYELLGKYDEAEQCFTQMLRHAWIMTHRGKAGAALNKIGRLYRARGDGAAARAFLNRGMALFKAAGDEKGVAACLGDLGELARRQGSYDRAFKLVSEALEIQRKLENKRSIAVCLNNLGHIEAARASYSQAERYLEEALDMRRQAGDKGGMAQTLSTLAIVLFNRGDIERAITRWEAALGLAEEVGDRRMLAIVNNNLGEALRDQGKLDLAMKYFQACEEVVTTLDDLLLHSEVSRNMGILAFKMGDVPSAREHLNRSLTLAKEMGGREMEGLALRALGELESTTMWDTSNVDGKDKADNSFDEALAIFTSIGNDFEVARTLHSRGNRALEKGDMDTGRALLEEARTIFQRIDSKAAQRVNRTLAEIAVQPAPSTSRSKNKSKKVNPARKAKDTLPDMTDELEPIEFDEE
ncbi:MAG: tetratricopeptide repeat protein [Deltaproteobacteria bacterium]|nr:tetratricopeptide repeat protein [Deltaproteobacteria bacterium]